VNGDRRVAFQTRAEIAGIELRAQCPQCSSSLSAFDRNPGIARAANTRLHLLESPIAAHT